ncbi:hypothetical protein DYB32_004641 [Aphanomyces invadans]|nr:hypothetical protein DYB32_004641 [Aphanomyces invadans]
MASSTPSLAESIRNIPLLLEDLFLPRDHTTSTSPDYLPYVRYQFIASVAGSTCGVLSMQSLLFAIGLQSGAIPMAAALNWVIKDGLGQFGGVLFASLVNHRFDADPKRWRMVSAFAMDAATLVEILTPLCPAYFLPMAATANVAKNISWLSSSATRAGFHYSFAQKENLADITAKAGSQSIASSIVGTALGIAISPIVGSATANVAAAFGVLSAIHLVSIYKSLSIVALHTLNQQRLHLVIDHYWQGHDRSTTHLANENPILSPSEVSANEAFVLRFQSGYPSRFQRTSVALSSRLDKLRLETLDTFANERYLLQVDDDVASRRGARVVHLLLHADATSVDVLKGHLHLVRLRMLLEDGHLSPAAAMEQSRHDVHRAVQSTHVRTSVADHFINHMLDSDWHCDHLLVEETVARYRIHAADTNARQPE